MKFIHYLMAISQFAIENGTLHSGFTMIYQVNMRIFHSKSYILIGISLINHPFWVAPMTMETPRSPPLLPREARHLEPATGGDQAMMAAQSVHQLPPGWFCSMGIFGGFQLVMGVNPQNELFLLGKIPSRFLDDDWRYPHDYGNPVNL